MLKIDNACLDYGAVRALDGVSIEVPFGTVTAVIGSNGAGKSSLMKAIMGLAPMSSGSIALGEKHITGFPPSLVVSCGITLVPEGRELFPRMTVWENLSVGASLVKDRAERARNFERVLAMFPVLERKIGAQARSLSGGEQQMLAFGRALMASPKMLLLDEPSIGLAPMLEEHIMTSVRETVETFGVGVLLVEQNAMLALESSEHAYVMELGRVIKTAPSSDLLADPSIAAAYLGV